MRKPKLTKKQIDREITRELENEFTKEQLIKLLVGFNRNHLDLTKWLYDNHRDILREYEKTKGNLQIHFLSKEEEKKKELHDLYTKLWNAGGETDNPKFNKIKKEIEKKVKEMKDGSKNN